MTCVCIKRQVHTGKTGGGFNCVFSGNGDPRPIQRAPFVEDHKCLPGRHTTLANNTYKGKLGGFMAHEQGTIVNFQNIQPVQSFTTKPRQRPHLPEAKPNKLVNLSKDLAPSFRFGAGLLWPPACAQMTAGLYPFVTTLFERTVQVGLPNR